MKTVSRPEANATPERAMELLLEKPGCCSASRTGAWNLPARDSSEEEINT
jgi:hypothetical protein